MRCHVRCRHCEMRRCLKRKLSEYLRVPACEVCGKRNYRVDSWMNRRDTTRVTCSCSGYWFPHRQGSLFCWQRAAGTQRYPGDPDFADRNFDGLGIAQRSSLSTKWRRLLAACAKAAFS